MATLYYSTGIVVMKYIFQQLRQTTTLWIL